ncbi:MAG: NAD(P)(+) transhydrogenase (Re/Si-specific) subunit beta [Saprospiraceae bacterium]|nr:NAD(P)(+) transhydrogenase (Re/Si-specific) subunit beta [Saprospiraceae bacterium]
MVFQFIIYLAYLFGALTFVWALRMLSSPETARRGNIVGAIGMGVAILAAMVAPMNGASNNYIWIIAALVVGGWIGIVASYRVKMTAMPQMVAVFNGLGGACAVLLAASEIINANSFNYTPNFAQTTNILFTLLVGGVTFTGSMLAYAKLEELLKDNKFVLPKHAIFNLVLLVVILAMGIYILVVGLDNSMLMAVAFAVLSLLYGISFVVPIGGADMPVVIALLNAFSGISAMAAGIIYDNRIMIVGGILVGASGVILAMLMCQAMNRSLLNVLVGGFGGGGSSAKAAGDQVVREISLNESAIQLFYSQSVVFVPGYGLAVAQAQKVCKEVDDILTANGVDVKYAIHPVAGRMPGHMNVLLAEADVPYPKLLDLDDANAALANADIAVIIGANDVVNPAAEDDPGSPIYGMPVLKVWDAKHVIVLKRSMRSGYAGIENPLFFHKKTRMLFGDAKDTLTKLTSELKTL